MGLNKLEPTSRPGGAARNVATLNANFAVLEREITERNTFLAEVRTDILQRIGALDQKITSNETSIKDAVSALTAAVHGNVRSNFKDYVARASKKAAQRQEPVTVVDSSDDDDGDGGRRATAAVQKGQRAKVRAKRCTRCQS